MSAKVKHISGITLLLILSCVLVSTSLSADKEAPFVEKTDPTHGLIGAATELSIQVWLRDAGDRSDKGPSGIDPTSVQLYIAGGLEPVHVMDLGNSRVLAYTKNVQTFPENFWVNAEVYAKDRAGNTMEPYRFTFCTEDLPDVTSPVIDLLSPADKSTGNMCYPVISCRLWDDSGIDINATSFRVNGDLVNFTYSNTDAEMQLFHVPDNPFDYEESVQVRVKISDYSGNSTTRSWTFQIREAPPNPPKQNFPTANSLINYQKEQGNLRFVWSTDSSYTAFRLRIRAEDRPACMVFDLGPDDYWQSGFLTGFNYYFGYENWKHYSSYDYLEWSIALLDGVGGNCVSGYSSWSKLMLAPPDAVVIRSPSDNTVFNAFDDKPVFTWDQFDGAVSYLLGIAKFNPQKNVYENKVTMYVESEVTSIVLEEHVWHQLGSGNFIWAVLAETPSGHYSDFMNYEFRKNAPIIIDTIISFN